MKTGAVIASILFTAVTGLVGCNGPKTPATEEKSAANKVAKDDHKVVVPTAKQPKPDIYKVPVGDSYQKGSDDALVTIVEFSDFQCPFCARVLPTLSKIEKNYGEDVRVVFKHQPLPFHRDAPLASEYALAAGEQGKFWEMHDKLFEHQKELKEDNLKQYAKELNLDQAKIDAYISSGKGKQVIQADQKLARKIGATGTPAFFINGALLSGARPYASFQQVIDAAKARAEKLVTSGVGKGDVYAKLIEGGRETAPPRPQRKRPPVTRQRIELVDTTPRKGGNEPLVTIVEFSDFQCPFCSRVNPTLAQIMKTYGDDVQVRFRNQPLSFHKQALPAAKAALAAKKQGRFWEMHDLLFKNQKALKDDNLRSYASELGLDIAQFEADLKSQEIAEIIAADQKAAAKYGARGTPTLFANGVPIRGAQPFAAFKQVIDKEIALAKTMMKAGTPRATIHKSIIAKKAGEVIAAGTPTARPGPTKPVDVKIGNAPTFGSADAPVKVVVFSDFECPFCGRVNPSIERIKKEYGSKVSISFKHFPLSFHRNAKPAAIASLAAHRQGKFWEMHDKLFENQRALTKENFIKFADEMGLNVDKFTSDLEDPSLGSWVDADMRQGGSVGVRGTPASFINGRMVSGAQPFDAFKAVIDDELKKKKAS